MNFSNFFRPATVEEAIRLHREHQGVYLAGGTDVVVKNRESQCYRGKAVIDLTAVQELRYIVEEETVLRIGAMTTHREIAASEPVRRYAPVLAEGSGSVGSPQIRNRGTIGGNLGNASPAADTLAPLALLKAVIVVEGSEGRRELPVDQFITGPYRNALKEDELIREVVVEKLGSNYRQTYYKLGRREALAISRLTVCAAGRLEEGRIADLRISIGSAFPSPRMFPEINAMGEGKQPSVELFRSIAKAEAAKLPEIAGVRASTMYKQPVSEKLIQRLLCQIYEVKEDG